MLKLQNLINKTMVIKLIITMLSFIGAGKLQALQPHLFKYFIFDEAALVIEKENGLATVTFLINNRITGPFLKYDFNDNQVFENGFYHKNRIFYSNKWDYDSNGKLVRISRTFHCLNGVTDLNTREVIVYNKGVYEKNTFRFINFKPFNYASQIFVWATYPNASSNVFCYDEVVGSEIFSSSEANELVDSSLALSKSNNRNFVGVLNEGTGENYFVGFKSFMMVLFYDITNQFSKRDEITVELKDYQCDMRFQLVPLCGFYVNKISSTMHFANKVCLNLIW